MMKLPKMPKGRPDSVRDAAALETFRTVVTKFGRLADIIVRCRQAGVKPLEVLGLKPWDSPNCETITEAQYEALEAAIRAAGAKEGR